MRSLFALALMLPLSLAASARFELAPLRPAEPQAGAAVARAPSPVPQARHSGLARRGVQLPGPFPADVLEVIDGDTVEVRVMVWLGQEITTRLRLRGIDAPELASPCADERRLAREARERLMELIEGEALRISDVGLDKYGGRVVGRLIFAGGEDVGALLAQEGYARLYDGGRRDGWCEPVLSAGR